MIDRAAQAAVWGAALVWALAAWWFGVGLLLIPAAGMTGVGIVVGLTSERFQARRIVRHAVRTATEQAWAEYGALTELAQTAGDHAPAMHARRAALLRSLGHHSHAAAIEQDLKGRES